ncbi:hypothetical protein JZU48_04130 [bacterium]|nr:hypothetical protein [bacterium]
MTLIDLDAMVQQDRLPKVRLFGRALTVRPMTGASAHRMATAQTDDPTGNAMFAVLLEVIGRSIPELSKKELETLSVEQVMAVVQLTRGQVSEVEAAIAAKAESDAAGK